MTRIADPHYFDAEPAVPSRPAEVRLGDDVLLSDRGVFSSDHLDPGTVELLRAVPPPPARGDLLDLGCGYGPIAVTMAKKAPGATVWAVDTNRRAVSLTRENASRLSLGNLKAVTPDEVETGVCFGAIWSNPPIRIGKQPLHDLLLHWLDRLTPDGRAYLVVHKHLGGDSLTAWLIAEGYPTAKFASRKGYRLLEVAPR